jgi:hypothetical protein
VVVWQAKPLCGQEAQQNEGLKTLRLNVSLRLGGYKLFKIEGGKLSFCLGSPEGRERSNGLQSDFGILGSMFAAVYQLTLRCSRQCVSS